MFFRSNVVNTCELRPQQVATRRNAGIMAELKIGRKKILRSLLWSPSLPCIWKASLKIHRWIQRCLGRNGWSSCITMSCWATLVVTSRCCMIKRRKIFSQFWFLNDSECITHVSDEFRRDEFDTLWAFRTCCAMFCDDVPLATARALDSAWYTVNSTKKAICR